MKNDDGNSIPVYVLSTPRILVVLLGLTPAKEKFAEAFNSRTLIPDSRVIISRRVPNTSPCGVAGVEVPEVRVIDDGCSLLELRLVAGSTAFWI